MPEIYSQPINFADRVGQIVNDRISNHSDEYAKINAPTSPHPELTQNTQPGISKLKWLKGRSKCNQFVGDILTLLGLSMPTFRMKDGSKHYANAESLLKFDQYFSKIVASNAVRPGDLLVSDYLDKKGENGAHVQIITKVTPEYLELAGANKEGASYSRFNLSKLAKQNYSQNLSTQGKISYSLLRPTKLLEKQFQ